MKKSRVLIKLGGASLQESSIVRDIVHTIRRYRDFGYQVILVHGGGPAINAELTRRGIAWTFLNGQRVTTPEMMETIEMVLCGSINRQLVRALNSERIPAAGLSGVDGNTLFCVPASAELGQVGAIQTVRTNLIEGILSTNDHFVPVIAPLGVGAAGEAFNINADWAASRLASALGVDQLIFLTDQKGILDEQKNLLPQLTAQQIQSLIDSEVISGGMMTKTLSVLHALRSGISTVRILHARDSLKGLWSDQVGTQCLSDEYIPAVAYA